MECKYCGIEFYKANICGYCMANFATMKKSSFDYLKNKFGPLSFDNQDKFRLEMKRLERLYKRNEMKFWNEIEKSETRG